MMSEVERMAETAVNLFGIIVDPVDVGSITFSGARFDHPDWKKIEITDQELMLRFIHSLKYRGLPNDGKERHLLPPSIGSEAITLHLNKNQADYPVGQNGYKSLTFRFVAQAQPFYPEFGIALQLLSDTQADQARLQIQAVYSQVRAVRFPHGQVEDSTSVHQILDALCHLNHQAFAFTALEVENWAVRLILADGSVKTLYLLVPLFGGQDDASQLPLPSLLWKQFQESHTWLHTH